MIQTNLLHYVGRALFFDITHPSIWFGRHILSGHLIQMPSRLNTGINGSDAIFRTFGAAGIYRPNTSSKWFGCYVPAEHVV